MIQEGRRYALWLNGNRKHRFVTICCVDRESGFFETVERPGRWVAWKMVDAYEEVATYVTKAV